MVLNCERTGERSDLVEQAVADEIGLPRDRVFPPRAHAAVDETRADASAAAVA